MKLLFFDDFKLGVLKGDAVVDVSDAVRSVPHTGPHDLISGLIGQFADYKRPEPTIPNSIGHHKEWLEGIRTGSETTCNFDYAGALTEAVLLGTVAYRSGKKIEWDAANLKVTNSPEAQQLIHKEFRKGWVL